MICVGIPGWPTHIRRVQASSFLPAHPLKLTQPSDPSRSLHATQTCSEAVLQLCPTGQRQPHLHDTFSPNTRFPADCKDWDETQCHSPHGLVPKETASLQNFLPQMHKSHIGKQNLHLSCYFTNQLKTPAMLHGPSATHCSRTALCFNPLSIPQRQGTGSTSQRGQRFLLGG